MSSAFQLSSAYRPYLPPLTEVSTMVAGMAISTAATSSFPGQRRANVAVSRASSTPSSRRRVPDPTGEGGWVSGRCGRVQEKTPVGAISCRWSTSATGIHSACGRHGPRHKDTLLTMSATGAAYRRCMDPDDRSDDATRVRPAAASSASSSLLSRPRRSSTSRGRSRSSPPRRGTCPGSRTARRS